MLRIQPESELQKLYSFDNSSGQLKWHLDEEFREFRESRVFGEYYSDLADFFFNKGMLFEFCLLVEGCKRHEITHGYEWCETKVAKALHKVRGS
jgi:hypothetical protein